MAWWFLFSLSTFLFLYRTLLFFMLLLLLSLWKQNWFEFEQNVPNNLSWLEMHRISVLTQIGVWMHECGCYQKLNVHQNSSFGSNAAVKKHALRHTLFESAVWVCHLKYDSLWPFSCSFSFVSSSDFPVLMVFPLHSWLCFYYMLCKHCNVAVMYCLFFRILCRIRHWIHWI